MDGLPATLEKGLENQQADPQTLVEKLRAIPSPVAQRQLLAEQVPLLDREGRDRLAEALKKQADELRRADIHRCSQIARLIGDLADLTADPLHRALGLLALANACSIGFGEYKKAVDLYAEAAAIYGEHGCLAEQAQSQIGKIYALANLGRYDEALQDGAWASQVLREQGEWFVLARLTLNLGIVHGRLGQDAEALALFDRARDLHRDLGPEADPYWLRIVELNRAVVLRNLGRFQDSIQANQAALEMYRRLGQAVAAARAQQNLAVTYFVMGRYNEALALLDEAREIFLADGRRRHAMLVELFISDCLLQLRRFPGVLEKCSQVRALFSELGTVFEVGQAILNEASAYVGMERYDDALTSLAEARRLFEQEGNHVAVADTDLQVAAVLLCQGQPEQGLTRARACAAVFHTYDLPIKRARAYLVAARAAVALDRHEQARELVNDVLSIGELHNLPALTYQSHHLRGMLAVREGQCHQGLVAYERAIQELERLCGRLMVEFRVDFIEDKERLYEDVVLLCLDLNRPSLGLQYAERAKSRALLELLAHRLDLSIRARSESDRPLVDELVRLRAERDRHYRRWESGEGFGQRGETAQFLGERHATELQVLALEKRITDLWHKLLIRNADYARDAAVWQVRIEPIQPYLDPDTLLLEYFIAHGKLVVFLVTVDAVQARVLSGELAQIQHLLQLLWLNLRAVPRSPSGLVRHLTTNAHGILQKLYLLLMAPLAAELAPYQRLIIVPHGPLHYLPFQTLHDGRAHLLERHEVCYLPGASFLRYCREAQPADDGLLAVGHSYEGRLFHAVREAQAVAHLWQGQAVIEDAATLAQIRKQAPRSRILHLATHGDFRPDNPLFSGLALADGWLTTLDIFTLRLRASLVTLSACQTGRSVVGGGDELLGLMRAFLSAGAASLVSTLWAVEDRSTAQLMHTFYQKLAQGWTKGSALRQAQLQFIHGQPEAEKYRHPYFWGPFFLVGDAGPL